MLNDIFENRDKKLANVIKLGHFLARSLRENVELFKYNSDTNRAYYLTESKKLISGTVVNGNKLSKLEVEDATNYFDQKRFNKKVTENITGWLGNLYEDKYLDAEGSFASILTLWEERSKLTKLNTLLEHKLTNLNENKDILKTKEFKKLVESLPALVDFLKKNKDKITKIAEIKNGVILSNTIANAFGIPRINYETLTKNKKYELSEDSNSETLFNLITRQELIRTELIESKRNFEAIWSDNDNVKRLASCINSSTEEVHEALAAVVIEVPYFAMLSKKQLTEMFDSLLNEGEVLISPKNIQKYSSYIFECKKEIKNELISVLNEKYGINIQNLKDPVTYRSLLNTQIIIFESIRRLLPKDSVYRPVVRGAIEVLKEKSGVEAIDVNDLIHEMFTRSEYSFISESVMSRYLNFDEIATDLGNVANVLKMIKGTMGGQQSPMGGGMGQPGMQQPGMGGGMPPMPGQGMPQPQGQPGMGMPPATDPSEEDLSTQGLTPEDDEQGIMPGQEDPMMGQEEGEPPTEMGGGQLMASIAELEELINGLKVKLGEDPGADEGMPPEMGGGEGEMPEEGMEDEEGMEPGMEGEEDEEGEVGGDININTGEGDDDVHVDKTKGSHDVEDEDEVDEEMPPKKKGKPEKKEKPEGKKENPFKKGKK